MHTAATDYLSQPLLVPARQPIRIAVYSRIAAGIRSGTLPAGTLLPRESELAAMLDVSRTPVREALILLEEDGLLTTKRGVGRFVSDTLPTVGLEKIRPFEEALTDPDAPFDIAMVRLTNDPATEFAAEHLEIPVGAATWFRENLLSRNGQHKVIVQEHVPADPSTRLGERLNALIRQHGDDDRTLLGTLIDAGNMTITAGECRICISTAGKSRAALLEVDPDAPVLVLTEIVRNKEQPVYLGKVIIAKGLGDLSIMQSAI